MIQTKGNQATRHRSIQNDPWFSGLFDIADNPRTRIQVRKPPKVRSTLDRDLNTLETFLLVPHKAPEIKRLTLPIQESKAIA
jgi:hypothetical protein